MNATAVARRGTPPAAAKPGAPPAERGPSKVAPPIRPSAPGRRRRPKSQWGILLAAVVGAPTLLAALYFGLIASPLYISEASVTIRSSKAQGVSLFEGLINPNDVTVGNTETQLVADYLRSRDLMERVDREINFRERFTSYKADFFSRLEPGASKEQMHSFFKDTLRVTDDGAGLLTLTVRAFTPDDAVAVASSAIGAAEQMVNRLSEVAQEDALRAALAEVERGEERMIRAANEVTAYQKASGDIDPRRSADAVLGVIAGLEAELATSRVAMASLRSNFRADTPQVNSLNSKIAALERQIAVERRRLADSNSETLTEDLRGFNAARLQLELAEAGYKSALASLEAARASAQNDRSYLVAYAPPSLPDVAVEPKRMYKIATAFVVSLLAFGVGSLIVGAVREHARA